MKKTFEKIKIYIKKHGLKITIYRFALLLLNPILSVRTIYLLNIQDVDWKRLVEKNFSFAKMTAADLEAVFKVHSDEISLKRYQTLKKIISSEDSACYKILNNEGEICSYNCLAFKKSGYENSFAKIDGLDLSRNGYILKDYTFKKYRNQGMLKYGYYKRLQILKEFGFKTATVRIAKYNFIPEYTSKEIGFKKELVEIHFHFFNLFPNSNFFVFRA